MALEKALTESVPGEVELWMVTHCDTVRVAFEVHLLDDLPGCDIDHRKTWLTVAEEPRTARRHRCVQRGERDAPIGF